MDKILLFGINHKTTQIAKREKLSTEELSELIYSTYFPHLCSEFIVLSTCNRTEILVVTKDVNDAKQKIEKLSKRLNPYVYEGKKAVKHLYEVACGLDSMILGESEILSQIKKAYTSANKNQTVGPILHQVLKQSISIGKRVRHETKIGTGITSIAHSAILTAKKNSLDIHKSRTIVIGAGTVTEKVIKYAKQHSLHCVITNRTYEKASQLGKNYEIEAISFIDLDKTLRDTDIVISAAASQRIILSTAIIKKVMKGRSRPLCLIDLGVPRNIDPNAAKLTNVHLYNIDQLQQQVDNNLATRKNEIIQIKKIISEEVDNFFNWHSQHKSTPLLHSLQNQATAIREAEPQRAFNKLANLNLDTREKNIISLLAKRIEGKLLTKPLRNIKRLSVEQNGQQHLSTIKAIFDL